MINAQASVPRRTCVGCGTRDSQGAMIRLQVDADGALVPVVRGLSGRSAYVHGTPQCTHALLKSRLLRRSLRRDVDKAERGHAIERLGALPAQARFAGQRKHP